MQNLPHNNTPKTSGLAIASLVFGILDFIGLAICGGSFVAIICGHLALSKIKQSGGMIAGRGLAIAGLVLGYVSLAITALFMLGMGGIAMIGASFESSQKARADEEMAQYEQAHAQDQAKAAAEKAQARLQREQADQAAESQRVDVPVSVLSKYVRDYNYGPGGYQVRLTGSTLHSSSRDGQCELVPTSEVEFILTKCTNDFIGRVRFEMDARGQLQSVTIIHPGGREEEISVYEETHEN